MKRSSFAILFSLVLLFGISTEIFAAPKTTVKGYLAATSLELFEKAALYRAQDDEEALKKLLATGLVFILKAGLKVEVVEVKSSLGLVKIRPRGETIEVWTNIEAIE
ncbi:MAG: hypothetical protein Q8M07_00530 [Prosthecobacter sp.]|nr:hypothetical protein [Prosthecobacter sp.]